MDQIRFQAPQLPTLDDAQKYWSASEQSQWFSNGGPCLKALEVRLADYVGESVEAVPVSSATAGLLIALRAVAEPGVRKLVVVPSYTFAATAAIVHWAGFEPLFVDIDPEHWHVDPGGLADALRAHPDEVAAAVLCSTYGTAPPRTVVAEWERLCAEHSVPLVVDSAAGFGSRDEDGRPIGTAGDAEVFSFHATKPFAIGEGGVVMTKSSETAARLRRLANFGFSSARVVDGAIGLNGKMDELHAALALCVLDQLEGILERRRGYAEVLRLALEEQHFSFQTGNHSSAFQFLPMLCSSREERDALIARAAEQNIELRAYFGDPLHQMPAFGSSPRMPLPVTDDVAGRVVCLPIYNTMTDSTLQRLIAVCTPETPAS
ncbi:aminotransferase class I/II-fold pyridoxal phosphate-dependent enzyme [Nocardioides panacis]|uniref:Aminotransferase class I/II-fold pyridoxal phosphate-dependent enzyme n=1 Tax=Nocardioides panacis TaxID=2849501 RepID=A0A975SY69_9ACTN|nr:aminotransferase class I/II-fold pyridoxal phosphate-dependent enzyme [Nocardioides panacis]QWZ08140.1 aminotransferase class I/II-fold pyridoxal phosphate-dependent enzyme [Nocardioides panacis]